MLRKYEDQLKRATDKFDELKQKGEDIKNLSQKIEDSVSKHIAVLEENLTRVPETNR